MEIVTGVSLMLTGIFLIFLVLLQRGGGGLISTLNGSPECSVFGTRSDRVYSRITPLWRSPGLCWQDSVFTRCRRQLAIFQ